MAEERSAIAAKEPAKKKLEHGAFSRKALREFRENLPRSVVPVALTVLGALAFQSVSFLAHFLSEVRPMMQEMVYERQKDIALLKNDTTLDEQFAPFDVNEELKTIESFDDATLSGKLIGINNSKRKQFASQFSQGVANAEQKLGNLEGFIGFQTTKPSNWLPSVLELCSANLRLLETASECANHAPVSIAARRDCVLSVDAGAKRLLRAASRAKSANDVVAKSWPIRDAERELRWRKSAHKLDLLAMKATVALLGFGVSLWAYGMLFSNFLKSERIKT